MSNRIPAAARGSDCAEAHPSLPMDPRAIDPKYDAARIYLERLQSRLRKKGIRAHSHVLLGPVVQTMVDLYAHGPAEQGHGRGSNLREIAPRAETPGPTIENGRSSLPGEPGQPRRMRCRRRCRASCFA